MKKTTEKEPILICSGHYGVYIPQRFAADARGYIRSNASELSDDLLFLEESKPETDGYWEAWENVLDNFTFTDYAGTKYTLYQSDDLWAIPEGYENESFFNS